MCTFLPMCMAATNARPAILLAVRFHGPLILPVAKRIVASRSMVAIPPSQGDLSSTTATFKTTRTGQRQPSSCAATTLKPAEIQPGSGTSPRPPTDYRIPCKP